MADESPPVVAEPTMTNPQPASDPPPEPESKDSGEATPDARPTALDRAKASAARRLAAQNAQRQHSSALQQQLQAAQVKTAEYERLVAELRAKADRADEDPITRWMREGKNPDQVREEIQRLADPTLRKLHELEQKSAEREAQIAAERKSASDREAQTRAAASRARVEKEFVLKVDSNPSAYPYLLDLPPRMIVSAGYDLLSEYVSERQSQGDPRSREQITSQDFSDSESDVRLLAAINRRIQERAEARRAKAVPSAAPPTGGASIPTGKVPAPSTRPNATILKASTKDLDSVDWDKLSDSEQFRLMAAHVERTGSLKTRPKPSK